MGKKVWDLVLNVVYVIFFWAVVAKEVYTKLSGDFIENMDQTAAGDIAVMATIIVFVFGLICINKVPQLFEVKEEK